MQKKKVAIIFGGRSGEHEVSLVSASSVVKYLDREKYEALEIGITYEGKWLVGENCLEKFKKQDYSGLETVMFSTDRMDLNFDVAFPVLHGPFAEDGTVQGLFEMLNVPYVGCNVLASSTAMDKLQCKAILEAAALPVVEYFGFTRHVWQSDPEAVLLSIEEQIGIPCFVKPANMGSSVGITKAKSRDALIEAINVAAGFDRRILVEKALRVREIECAVIGNDEIEAAPLGEIIVGGEFYDFYDKYVDGRSYSEVPANIDDLVAEKIRDICLKAYRLLDCSGLARVDCFIDQDSGEIYFNEINTMPGFTSISMYPKMMEAYGINYSELISRLIELGIERYEDKGKNKVKFDSGSDWFKS